MMRARIPGPVTEETVPLTVELKEGRIREEGSTTKEEAVFRLPQAVEGETEKMAASDLPLSPLSAVDSLEVPPETPHRGEWGRLFSLTVLLAASWILYTGGVTLVEIWNHSRWLGLPLLLLSLALLTLLFRSGWREYRARQRVDALITRHGRLTQALKENNLAEYRAAMAPTLENLRQRYPRLLTEFEDAASHHRQLDDYLRQLENIVLTRLDREVDRLIQQSAYRGGAGVMFLPHPSLDALFVLWQGAVLVKKIGGVYGLNPTGLSSWRLLKYSITSATIVAGMEVIGDQLLREGSEGRLGLFFKPLAEGSVTAWRMYRFGKRTQRLCRPRTTLTAED
ncbi:MAG: DUF697 domain-containing protein [Gammaproteobacteria bacterium]|nr:DUF697 domain-containing protein [Gammaproteobacteria bacterium]